MTFPKLNDVYVRTCEECGYEQKAKDPKSYKDKANKETWRDVLCRKCKSAGLDYGSWKDGNYRLNRKG